VSSRGGRAVMALLMAAAVAAPQPAAAAAWTQTPGDAYLKIWGRLLVGSGGFLGDGSYVTVPGGFVDASIHTHVELGILPWLTLLASATPWGWALAGGRSTAYFGAVRVGARAGWALPQWPALRLAGELRYGYNPGLGATLLAAGLVGRRLWRYTPTVEGHDFDAEGQAGIGLPHGLWAVVTAGMRLRSRGKLGPIVIGSAQLGWRSPIGIVVDARLMWHQPTGSVRSGNVSGAGGTRYVGGGASVAYWFNDAWGLFLGFEGGMQAEANAGAPVFLAGIEHR